jgi:hypothetical protein
MDPVAYRSMHRRRSYRRAAIAATAFTAIAVVVAITVTPADDDQAVTTSTIGDLTTTTTGSVPPTTGGGVPVDVPPGGVLGAGWEELYAGPLTGGRYRAATAWTGDALFVFGGHLLVSQETPLSDKFLQDAYLFDPGTESWRGLAVPPGLCHLDSPQAMWLEGAGEDGAGRVFLYGNVGDSRQFESCSPSVLYDPVGDEWMPLGGPVGGLFSTTDLVWVPGDAIAPHGALVVPGRGLAYDLLRLGPSGTLEDGYLALPALNQANPRLVWTGTEVIAFGQVVPQAWAPGDDTWHDIAEPPVPTIARDAVITADGLLLVNYQMAAAWYTGGGWERHGDLPLRFYECYPEPVSAGGTPVVRMCSGVAIWDAVRGTWVPVPLEDITGAISGSLIGTDEAVYSLGARFRRFTIERNPDGSIIPPDTLPIGVDQIDLPDGYDFVSSFAPSQNPDGTISVDETIGFVVDGPGGECRVSSTYSSIPLLEGGPETVVDRPGRPQIRVLEVQDAQGRSLFAYPDQFGSDVVRVVCDARDDAIVLLSGLWSPWEQPPEVLAGATLVVTPGHAVAGSVVQMVGTGFESGWGHLWLVDPDGDPVVEIPVNRAQHLSEFAWVFALDRSDSPGVSVLQIADGAYGFAVDGRIVAGATLEVSHPESSLLELVEASRTSDEIVITLENVDTERLLPIGGWSVYDEVRGASLGLIPGSEFLEPGDVLDLRLHAVGEAALPIPPRLSIIDETATGGHRVLTADLWASVGSWGPAESMAVHGYGYSVDYPGVLMYRWMSGDDGWVTIRDDTKALAYRLPVDTAPEFGDHQWQVADEVLTPYLVAEVISLGTYRLVPNDEHSHCAQFPVAALEDLGPTDAFIWVQRRTASAAGVDTSARARPDHFTYQWFDDQDLGTGLVECLERADRRSLYLRFGSFHENGRQYYVIVALGDQADGTVRYQQVLDILDGLVLDSG